MEQSVINATVAAELLPSIIRWFGAEPLESQDALRTSLTLSLEHSADAYERAKFLDTVRGWPADANLVTILSRAEGIESRVRQGPILAAADNVRSIFSARRFGD